MEANNEQAELALTAPRRLFRKFMRAFLRGLVRVGARVEMEGVDRVPMEGPLVVTLNHLSFLDPMVLLGDFPRYLDGVVAAEVLNVPIIRQILTWYGVIPVKRGEYDRRVLDWAVGVLKQGRALALAPEAGIDSSYALRQARDGAAYMALKSGARILPVAITGTQAAQGKVDSEAKGLSLRGMESFHLWRLRRRKLDVTLVFGSPFSLDAAGRSWREKRRSMEEATEEIMRQIAALLPSHYQGVYHSE